MQASENSCGTLYLRTAISISMPGIVDLAQDLLDAAHGLSEQAGGSVSSTTTTCPGLPAPVADLGIITSWP
jgi:hypothetical protein